LGGVVDEPLGATIYMDLAQLGSLLGEPDAYSAVSLIVDPARARELDAMLKRAPAAVAVDYRRGELAAYRAMSDTAMDFVREIDVLFSIVIAFGVVYNSAKIALEERARELATLRVLGFSRAEVSRVLLAELGSLAALAVPIGFGLGYWLSGLTLAAARGERMHFGLLIQPSTYAFALSVFAVATLASAWVVERRIARLDLAAVLKTRE
jgi:putative ABC transport system permease protein